MADERREYLQATLPQYQSHKKVWAAKILRVIQGPEDMTGLICEDAAGREMPEISVTDEWYEDHMVLEGGYLVVYADGYESWSPKEAFEQGNTLLPQD